MFSFFMCVQFHFAANVKDRFLILQDLYALGIEPYLFNFMHSHTWLFSIYTFFGIRF